MKRPGGRRWPTGSTGSNVQNADTAGGTLTHLAHETRAGSDRGTLALGLLFGVTLLVFAPTLASYPDVWRAQPYTHGYLIAVASLWLLWRERQTFRAPPEPRKAFVPVALALSGIWMLAAIADMRMVAQIAVPLALLAWSAGVFGTAAARRLVPIAAIFMLAVPVWGILTRPLQVLTVMVSGAAVGILRIPATIDGDMIHVSSGSFLIEGGCAGLNYLMSGLTIGALYTQLVPTRWRTRLAVVGVAALLTMIGNWVRVTGLIALGNATEMRTVFVNDNAAHLAFGWAIFSAGLLIFFPLAGLFTKRDRRPVEEQEPGGSPEAHMASEGRSRSLLVPAAVMTVAVTAGPIFYRTLDAVPARDVAPPVIRADMGEWTSAPTTPRPYSWTPAFEGADERDSAAWTRGSDVVLVDQYRYRDQEQGRELVGFTSRIAPDSLVASQRLILSDGVPRRVMREAIVMDDSAPLLVWYWYRVGGVETGSETRAKILEVWAFFRRTTVSELIAVSTACAPSSCEEASRTLQSFLGSSRDRPQGRLTVSAQRLVESGGQLLQRIEEQEPGIETVARLSLELGDHADREK